ncbi:MAG: response regulator [Novosphingobium sp. 32-60-15]|uniref:response regulator n=1 Tax=unclassified Novosphingobium TaxID=2644732 RepID=UPI000BD886D4|nr:MULTISPECIES: response regulator [unclassified Novosphingobium]OYX63382.1 MAG: response regulator [Novosphingobium sp. 32-60-15]
MRVIFVEDDALNRRVVQDMLSVIGVEMAEAEDAPTGLQMLARETYDLVLMDLRMPGMDGLTAIAHQRCAETQSQIPIIVVTADTAPDLKDRCYAAGANDVIMKPVALNALIDAIGRAVVGAADDDMMLD